MTPRKKLSDILHGNDQNDLTAVWNKTVAAGEYTPIPGGEYIARIVDGELTTASTGTGSYKLTFQILEGKYAERRFWHDAWLTPAALPASKRDLAKLGVTNLAQLELPLPKGIRCKVKLALRRDDDGNDRNQVRAFEVIGIDPPDVDPFAPTNPAAPPAATPPPAAYDPEDDDIDDPAASAVAPEAPTEGADGAESEGNDGRLIASPSEPNRTDWARR